MVAKGSQIVRYDASGTKLDSVDQFTVVDSVNSVPISDIQGLAFDMGTAGDVTDDTLYIADRSTGKISKPESTEGGRLVSILKWPEGALLNLG